MFRSKLLMVALAVAGGLSACEGGPVGAPKPADTRSEQGYIAPPTALEARFVGGVIVVAGVARAGAEIRLASPQGETLTTRADGEGRWSIELPKAGTPRIFGLSSTINGRPVQAEGYLLAAPAGQVALLRAGAGALRLDRQPRARITAFDFDREGGAVVSGSAPSGAALSLLVDGRQAAESRADSRGRFAISLSSPIPPGIHRLDISGDGFGSNAVVGLGPARALTEGPFRSEAVPGGFRIDWLTPGGGVQSTVILG